MQTPKGRLQEVTVLADKLVESLEFDTDSAIQAVWVTEAKRRRDEVRMALFKQFQVISDKLRLCESEW